MWLALWELRYPVAVFAGVTCCCVSIVVVGDRILADPQARITLEERRIDELNYSLRERARVLEGELVIERTKNSMLRVELDRLRRSATVRPNPGIEPEDMIPPQNLFVPYLP